MTEMERRDGMSRRHSGMLGVIAIESSCLDYKGATDAAASSDAHVRKLSLLCW